MGLYTITFVAYVCMSVSLSLLCECVLFYVLLSKFFDE